MKQLLWEMVVEPMGRVMLNLLCVALGLVFIVVFCGLTVIFGCWMNTHIFPLIPILYIKFATLISQFCV